MIIELQNRYKDIPQTEFVNGSFTLVPIRDNDKYTIMQWRNDQLDILRQQQPLTKEQQENYFKTVVNKLFDENQPKQLLFSFLENGKLIGYGGLVHIDWNAKVAEISFLTDTLRNENKDQFINDWKNYLTLIKEVARIVKFRKIFTYAYDLRPHLYTALFASGFIEEKRLTNEVTINGKKNDVLIHSCFLDELKFRMANEDDALLYFEWANDELVRQNSYEKKKITLEEHKKWFSKKVGSETCDFYLFIMGGEFAGQVRIDRSGNETVIGVSVDKKFRGKGISTPMLKTASADHLVKYKERGIVAYIKEGNVASVRSFENAGFREKELTIVKGEKSYKLIKRT